MAYNIVILVTLLIIQYCLSCNQRRCHPLSSKWEKCLNMLKFRTF